MSESTFVRIMLVLLVLVNALTLIEFNNVAMRVRELEKAHADEVSL